MLFVIRDHSLRDADIISKITLSKSLCLSELCKPHSKITFCAHVTKIIYNTKNSCCLDTKYVYFIAGLKKLRSPLTGFLKRIKKAFGASLENKTPKAHSINPRRGLHV